MSLGRADLQSNDLELQIAKSRCDVVLLSARASLSLTGAILKTLKEYNPKVLVFFLETALDLETARAMPFDGIVSITDSNFQIVENLRMLYRNRLQQFSPTSSCDSIPMRSIG